MYNKKGISCICLIDIPALIPKPLHGFGRNLALAVSGNFVLALLGTVKQILHTNFDVTFCARWTSQINVLYYL
jgi:hypothetical protein